MAGHVTLARLPLWIGLVLGLGLAGTLDEALFHQILRWHPLYVGMTLPWNLMLDGIYHLASSGLLFAGALLIWVYRERLGTLVHARALVAGILFALGGFQLFDGLILHKVVRLHPIRVGVADELPYDLAYNSLAMLILAVGWWLWRGARQRIHG